MDCFLAASASWCACSRRCRTCCRFSSRIFCGGQRRPRAKGVSQHAQAMQVSNRSSPLKRHSWPGKAAPALLPPAACLHSCASLGTSLGYLVPGSPQHPPGSRPSLLPPLPPAALPPPAAAPAHPPRPAGRSSGTVGSAGCKWTVLPNKRYQISHHSAVSTRAAS